MANTSSGLHFRLLKRCTINRGSPAASWTGVHTRSVSAPSWAPPQAAGVEDDTVAWAERVLRSRNDKPLTQKIEDVVRSAGVCGDAVLKAAPTFPSTVAGERAGVSHPGVGRGL